MEIDENSVDEDRYDTIGDLKRARKMPIVFDEECPETTPERAMKFRRVNPPRGTITGA